MDNYQNLYEKGELILKYLRNELSASEKENLDNWLAEDEANQMLFSKLTNEAILNTELTLYAASDKSAAKAKFLQAIDNRPTRKRFTLWTKITVAAAILLVVGSGLFFYNRYTNTLRHPELVSGPPTYANDIKPGSNKAYLTLANGKRLSLTDAANGALAKEAGIEISKTANGQVIYEGRDLSSTYSNALNTMETPKGGQYQVRLPDGTKVWLNAASKLIYPVSFNGREERRVELSGEAYFEVAKDKVHPFKVKSNGQEVTVLGTHFNINNYADEGSTKTTLLEGSVKVSSSLSTPALPPSSLRRGTTKQPQTSKETILKPGQQATLTSNQIKIADVDVSLVVAWKNGQFAYKNVPLETVMQQIVRWYDVDIVYTNPQSKLQTFSGTVSRYDNVSKILKAIEYTGSVKFKMEGRKIIIN